MLPALLFGVATVPMLYVFGRQVVREGGRAERRPLALSYHHVWSLQSARWYIVLAFALVVTTHLLLSAAGREHECRGAVRGEHRARRLPHLTFVFACSRSARWRCFAVALPARLCQGRLGADAAALLPRGVLTLALYAPMLQQIREYFRVPSEMSKSADATWAIGDAIRVLRSGLGDQLGSVLLVLGVCAAIGLAGVLSPVKRAATLLCCLRSPRDGHPGCACNQRSALPALLFPSAGFLVLIAVGGHSRRGVVVRVMPARLPRRARRR